MDLATKARTVVLGAGSWGTALAIHLGRTEGTEGAPVLLWGRDPDVMEQMRVSRTNRRYLPNAPLPPSVLPVSDRDLAETVSAADLVVAAVPTKALGSVLQSHRSLLEGGATLLLACKGIDTERLATMGEVAVRAVPGLAVERVAALGGPSFADEVAQGRPTAVVVGCKDLGRAEAVQARLSSGRLRAYVTSDVLGVELGGAFKNVVALAAGLCDGAGLGQNARAALITRGLAEITRLAVAMGARPETLAGLAGLGDLVLTCTGGQSRNRRVGMAIGKGASLQEALAQVGQVAEGVRTASAAHELAARYGVEMPICATMHAILYEGLSVSAAVDRLMARALRPEHDAEASRR